MALTLDRSIGNDSDNSISNRIDHLLLVLINRWSEIPDILDEIDSIDSYELMGFFFEWKKTENLWTELNSFYDGAEFNNNQNELYYALQKIMVNNYQSLNLIMNRVKVKNV